MRASLKDFVLENPTSRRQELANFLMDSYPGTHISCVDISRATKLLGLRYRTHTKKRIGHHQEGQRVLWWMNSLYDTPQGICNVAVECMIDMDEMGCSMDDIQRRAGYALPGQAVRVELPPYSKHLNLLMAADVNVGAIAPFVFPGTMDRNVFYCWLKKLLLPQIRGKKRVCLMDNHRAHLDVSIRELVEREGHKLVRRPVASPDMAWIETCFSQIKENLRKYCSDVNPHNLKECIYAEAELITGPLVCSFAAHCHYLVPGFPYHPYSGCAPLVDME